METPEKLTFCTILMIVVFLVECSIAAASTKGDTAKGLSWMMLLLGREASDSVTLVTPYVNESDIKDLRNGISSDKDSAPWGYVHDGIDIYPLGDLKPFQAACSGRVRWMYTGDEQVIVMIACNSTYTLEYNFETQAPDTGDDQLANIVVAVGETVSQGDIVGYHHAPNESAHVHFTLYRNWIPSCPANYFTEAAGNSMLSLLHVTFPGASLCSGDDVTPPPLVTPYADESDMKDIRVAFSSENSTPPWGYAHEGIDIYPWEDLKPVQAACSGTVDSIDLEQANSESNWQVEVLINCDEYVDDPDSGGYFIPFSTHLIFEPMTKDPVKGLTQLGNIKVVKGQAVSQGQIVGHLNTFGQGAHVQFGLEMFGGSFFSGLGVASIPLCPEPHFSTTTKDSILNLLHIVWPGAQICYQNEY